MALIPVMEHGTSSHKVQFCTSTRAYIHVWLSLFCVCAIISICLKASHISSPCIYVCVLLRLCIFVHKTEYCLIVPLSHSSSHLTSYNQTYLGNVLLADHEQWKWQNQNESFIILDTSCHALMNWLHECGERLID